MERAGSLDDDPSQLVDRCLDLLGGIRVSGQTYDSLVSYAKVLSSMKNAEDEGSVGVHNLLQMTASTVDYQFE